MTQIDNFPIPRNRDCLAAVAGAKLFSIFDVTSSYHQIPVREGKMYPKRHLSRNMVCVRRDRAHGNEKLDISTLYGGLLIKIDMGMLITKKHLNSAVHFIMTPY